MIKKKKSSVAIFPSWNKKTKLYGKKFSSLLPICNIQRFENVSIGSEQQTLR